MGVEAKNTKGIAFLEIINKSTDVILFKVKTTNINSYLVRPNAEIIEPDNSLNVRIETNHFIGVSNKLYFIFINYFIQGNKKLCQDKFLVQLTKVPENVNTSSYVMKTSELSIDEMQFMWDQTNKEDLVQYKLKVDIFDQINSFLKENAFEILDNLQKAVEEKKNKRKSKSEDFDKPPQLGQLT